MVFQILLSIMILTLALCGCRNKDSLIPVSNGRPIIYDAWDARYTYEIESRRMVPMYHGREEGRVWGRDEQGKIDQSSFTSSNKNRTEDLFVLYSSHLDRQREKKWELAKEKRLNFIKNQMEILEEEENAPLIEVPIEVEEEEFLPPAFIPQGIDLMGTGIPIEEEKTGDAPPDFPFAPLP